VGKVTILSIPPSIEEEVYPPCQPHLKEKSKIKTQKKSTREEFITQRAHTTHHPPPPRDPPATLHSHNQRDKAPHTSLLIMIILLAAHLQAHTYSLS
jgi:hypothetical protein